MKILQSYSANYSAFVMLGIKADNNFTLQFMLYKKSAHGMIFILLSFSE
jgi:hypothetical protein